MPGTRKHTSKSNRNFSRRVNPHCAHLAHPIAKKDAVKLRDLTKGLTPVKLTPELIHSVVSPYKKDDIDQVADKLKDLKLNLKFTSVYADPINNNTLWNLSCMYNNDIKEIKQHLLWAQANALVASYYKGAITLDNIQ